MATIDRTVTYQETHHVDDLHEAIEVAKFVFQTADFEEHSECLTIRPCWFMPTHPAVAESESRAVFEVVITGTKATVDLTAEPEPTG